MSLPAHGKLRRLAGRRNRRRQGAVRAVAAAVRRVQSGGLFVLSSAIGVVRGGLQSEDLVMVCRCAYLKSSSSAATHGKPGKSTRWACRPLSPSALVEPKSASAFLERRVRPVPFLCSCNCLGWHVFHMARISARDLMPCMCGGVDICMWGMNMVGCAVFVFVAVWLFCIFFLFGVGG